MERTWEWPVGAEVPNWYQAKKLEPQSCCCQQGSLGADLCSAASSRGRSQPTPWLHCVRPRAQDRREAARPWHSLRVIHWHCLSCEIRDSAIENSHSQVHTWPSIWNVTLCSSNFQDSYTITHGKPRNAVILIGKLSSEDGTSCYLHLPLLAS